MNLRFWVKTFLYRLTPGGYGYYRHLHRYQDPNYNHAQDKHAVRHKHFGSEGWKQEIKSTIIYRDYESYDEYIVHQQQKFDEMLKITGGFTNRTVTRYRLRFYSRFKHLQRLLPNNACIVCAGARQGTEVEMLHDLGFRNAYGIDLNPGPNNPFVRQGDFMHMDNPTSSVDLLYTNCIDHAYNLNDFLAEHARVIKPNGYVLYDLTAQSQAGAGPFESVQWKHEEEIFLLMLQFFKSVVRVQKASGWMWVLLQGKRESDPS
jgi:SAM-dependent methyltransferase